MIGDVPCHRVALAGVLYRRSVALFSAFMQEPYRATHRHTGSHNETCDPRNFKLTRVLRAIFVDQAQLGRATAHVERQHFGLPGLCRDVRGQNRTPRRARFRQADGQQRRRFNCDHASAGSDHQDRTGQPLLRGGRRQSSATIYGELAHLIPQQKPA